MRIIARGTLLAFAETRRGRKDYQALKGALAAWFTEVRKARWLSMSAVKQLYASASVVSAERIVFNVMGNHYRLIVAVDFEKGIVWIKWIGTHADYDKIDVRTVAYDP